MKTYTKRFLLLSLVMVLSAMSLSACSKADAEEKNYTVINEVLNQQFNGPDEELMDLLWNPKYTTIVENKQVNIELDQYIEEHYGPYFTDFFIESFMNTAGLMYSSPPGYYNYQMKLKDVVIEKDEKEKNRYTFSATVTFQKEDEEEKTYEVPGVVLFSADEENKIGKFQYREDNGLLSDMNEQ